LLSLTWYYFNKCIWPCRKVSFMIKIKFFRWRLTRQRLKMTLIHCGCTNVKTLLNWRFSIFLSKALIQKFYLDSECRMWKLICLWLQDSHQWNLWQQVKVFHDLQKKALLFLQNYVPQNLHKMVKSSDILFANVYKKFKTFS